MGIKQSLKEFKNFAMGGNMLDLALGVIIGAGFSSVVQSIAKDVIGDSIAAIIGMPNMNSVVIHASKGEIHIGNFITAIINFLILAFVLFGLVKLIKHYKLANFRAQGSRECPYCREFVPVDAVKCKFCTSSLHAVIDGDEGADERV